MTSHSFWAGWKLPLATFSSPNLSIFTNFQRFLPNSLTSFHLSTLNLNSQWKVSILNNPRAGSGKRMDSSERVGRKNKANLIQTSAQTMMDRWLYFFIYFFISLSYSPLPTDEVAAVRLSCIPSGGRERATLAIPYLTSFSLPCSLTSSFSTCIQ